jgi:hypothetical protein
MNKRLPGWCGLSAALAFLLVGPGLAHGTPQGSGSPDSDRAQADEIAELRRQLEVVVGELQELKRSSTVAETPAQLESQYGLGPAASKIYGGPKGGVSLGGYLEGNYSRQVGDAEGNGMDTANILRSVFYVGYKFTDKIIFNTELEVENANTAQGGAVEVELAQLDFLISPKFNIRTGLLLAPLGFINEVHEPPFFFGNIRPEPELRIVPSTFRENGLGIFGTLGESFSYRAYVLNSLDASGFNSAGLAGGKQNGARASANSLSFLGRFDYEPLEGLQLGASLLSGNTGQDRDDLPDAQTRLWEAHAQYRNGGLHFRALYTQADIADADVLSARRVALAQPMPVVADRLAGTYAEVAYDVMKWLRPGTEASLSPFFRFEFTDPQRDVPKGFDADRTQTRRIFVPGLQYKPVPNVVVKIDYRNIDPFEGEAADELRFGIGLAF